jgi:uncharacterized protein (TIGR02217 family)
MAITVLSTVIMPSAIIAAGVRGKNRRSNARAMTQSGFASVNINWSKTLRQYEIGIAPMTIAQWQALEGLHEVTEGGAYGFLMQDPKDASVDATAGLLWPYTTALTGSVGTGYGVPTYKLHKRYTVSGSALTKDRAVTRLNGAAVLKRDAAIVTQGASPGNASVDVATGTVTFVPDSTKALTSVTCGATTVLNFADGTGLVAAMTTGQRVYLAGLAGTAAATLNNLSHAITAKGASSLTVSTVTTGLAATGGTAYQFPQSTEALTWSGAFYVPVHFVSDDLDWDIVRSGPADTRIVVGPSVMLQEVRE